MKKLEGTQADIMHMDSKSQEDSHIISQEDPATAHQDS